VQQNTYIMEDKQVIKLELVTNLGNYYPFYDLENLLSSFHLQF